MTIAPNDLHSVAALPTHPAPASGQPDGIPGVAAVPAAQAFSEAEQRGVYRAIHERRDMRHFTGGSVALEVLRRLRSLPETAAVCCIALSANAMPDDIERALAAGFDDYWTKPIRFKPFLDALDRLFPLSTADH